MVFMMCLGLAGCGGGSNSTSDDISGKVSLTDQLQWKNSLMPYQKELKKISKLTIRSTIYRIWCRS